MILPVRGGGSVEVPDGVPCPGPCGGVPGHRSAMNLLCPVCFGSGRIGVATPVSPPPPADAPPVGRWAVPRFDGQGSVRKRQAKSWRGAAKREKEQDARVRARSLDVERKKFFSDGRAPDPALLDQLKAQFRAKLKGNR